MMQQMLEDIGDFIFLEDKPWECDAIFVPGGRDAEIPEKAAELWNAGYGKYLVPSGKYRFGADCFEGALSKADIYNKAYTNEADFYRAVFQENGVSEDVIIPEPNATYTKQNAFFSREELQKRAIPMPAKAMIVCKSYHARRALMYYQLAFPETEFRVIPITKLERFEISKSNWFETEVGREKVFGELRRTGEQFPGEF